MAILNEEQLSIQKMVREFAKKEIAPKAAHYDHTEEFPWKIFANWLIWVSWGCRSMKSMKEPVLMPCRTWWPSKNYPNAAGRQARL